MSERYLTINGDSTRKQYAGPFTILGRKTRKSDDTVVKSFEYKGHKIELYNPEPTQIRLWGARIDGVEMHPKLTYCFAKKVSKETRNFIDKEL